MSIRTQTTTRVPRKKRRDQRREARQAKHAGRFMAAPSAQTRMEVAWDWLRSVVAEQGDAAAHEAADVIRRTAERLESRTRK